MPNQFTIDTKIMRECYACGSSNTLLNGNGAPSWYLNQPTNLVLCQRCYTMIINYPRVVKDRNSRLMWFKGRQITLRQRPRTGICRNCGREGYTHMHHVSYDDIDPLKFTLELCPSCHAKETWKDFYCMKLRIRK
jgi:hypothetical protein